MGRIQKTNVTLKCVTTNGTKTLLCLDSVGLNVLICQLELSHLTHSLSERKKNNLGNKLKCLWTHLVAG